VADWEAQVWLVQALCNHEGAMGMVSHMQQLDFRDKQVNPGNKMTFKDWVEGLQVSFQQWDKVNKPKLWTKVKPPNEQHVNKNERGGPPYREKGTCQPMDNAMQAKFQEELKAMGMWIEPEVLKQMSGEQRKAHNEKVRTMQKAKKSKSTPGVPAPTPAPATTPVPDTYAMAAAQQPPQQPQQLEKVLESQFPNGAPRVFSYKGVTYRAAVANRTYEARTKLLMGGSLVDSGCNGGVAGNDILILEEHSFGEVDIVGVGNNMIKGVPLCTAAGLVQTTKGPVIAIMHHYAALKTGGSIHSPLQLRDHGVIIDDTSNTQCCFDREYGGQMIKVPSMNGESAYDLPLSIRRGLAYFTMRPPHSRRNE
jgi:hypothetical protein